MLIEILCVILCLILSYLTYLRYNRFGRLIAKIPGPTSYPIIGNLMPSDPEKLFKFLRSLRDDYGGRITRIFGLDLRGIFIYHPDDIETILSSTKFNDKYYPYCFLTPWLGNGLLVSNGSRWQHRRKLLTPAFHFSILRQFVATFSEHTAALLRALHARPAGEAGTDVVPLITKATLDIMCETSMGNSVEGEIKHDMKMYFNSLHTLGKCLITRLTNIQYYSDLIYKLSPTYRAQEKALKHLHGFTRKVIQNRRASGKAGGSAGGAGRGRHAMLDLLLQQERLGMIDEEGIREEVDTFMFEGHDTTSTSLCFMIMRIANEPIIQDLIYEELQSIFGESERAAEVEDLAEMKYLERCVQESLRLYPGVPFIARHLDHELVLGGHVVPPHTSVNIPIFDVHRSPALFPQPERFDPDRFLPDQVASRHPFAYIPFSAGSRNCIGKKFAMLEMKTVMSGLLRQFRLEPVTRPEDLVFVSDLVLRSRDPIYVRFCKRKTKSC